MTFPVSDIFLKIFRGENRPEKSSLVAMAEGFHAYPSRTRPLSPPAPMVLAPQGAGRVGRRQASNLVVA